MPKLKLGTPKEAAEEATQPVRGQLPEPAPVARFVSASPEAQRFNLYLKGETYHASWVNPKKRDFIEWSVPAEVADLVRAHHFYKLGRIKDKS